MRTHGSLSVEEDKQDEEEENKKKMENIGNKLERLEQNNFEEKVEKGKDLIDESSRGGKANEEKIEGEFDEQNLDD